MKRPHGFTRRDNRDPRSPAGGPHPPGCAASPDTATSPVTSHPGPSTMPALMRMLGISSASARHQHEALKRWLSSNTPHPVLRISLRQNGYGLLLDALFGRPSSPPLGSHTDEQC